MNEKEKKNDEGTKGVLERNISSLTAHRKRVEVAGGFHDRIVVAISRSTGSLAFLYLHVLFIGVWVLFCSGMLGFHAADSSFSRLSTFASIESLFLSIFVLVAQNRMSEVAEKRAELNVQISLLGEHEITRLLILTTSIARKMKLDVADDPELDELKNLISPDHVLQKIDEQDKKINLDGN
jgi:uncharacterized membrane protein